MRALGMGAALLMLCASAPGKAETYQDWFISGSPDKSRVLALTSNDGGAALTLECQIKSKTCSWTLISSWLCDDGNTYAVLANANSNVLMLHAVCERKTSSLGNSRLSFQEFEAMDALLKSADKVGFAVARSGDQFNVLRFSLAGEVLAHAKLMSMISPPRLPHSISVKEPAPIANVRR